MVSRWERFKINCEFIICIVFSILFFPLIWLMENENTKKGKVIIFIVQVVVSAIATIMTCNYLNK